MAVTRDIGMAFYTNAKIIITIDFLYLYAIIGRREVSVGSW